MAGKQVTELEALPSFTDNSLLPVHNGAGLKKGTLTQLSNYLGTKFSNPNLLINPDFRINQRGATSYERQGYSVDRWKISNVTVTPNDNGGITIKNDKYSDTGTFVQILENATEGDSTLSCYATSASGTVIMAAGDNPQVVLKQGLNILHVSNSVKAFTIFLNQGTSVTLKWVKLEQGSNATPFVAPNPSEELVKCQRFFEYITKSIAIPLIYNASNVTNDQKHYVIDKIYKVKKRINPTISVNNISDSGGTEINVGRTLSIDECGILTITFNAYIKKFTISLNNIIVDAEIY